MGKTLVIIDMQNDFIDGSLANEAAAKIVPLIVSESKSGKYDKFIMTYDTHHSDYLDTAEGKRLPVKHCIRGTEGHEANADIVHAIKELTDFHNFELVDKTTFGSLSLAEAIDSLGSSDEVVLCGTCTDICVISNALILKTMRPNLNLSVKADCCAGLTPEKHKAALDVMESCQINIL